MGISHFPTTKTSIAKSKSVEELERYSRNLADLVPGDILALEAPFDLGPNPVYVTSNRSIFFAKDLGTYAIPGKITKFLRNDFSIRHGPLGPRAATVDLP